MGVSRTKNPPWTPDRGLCGVQNKKSTLDTRYRTMWCPEQKIHPGHQIQDYVVSRTKNPLWTPDTGLCGLQRPDTGLCSVQNKKSTLDTRYWTMWCPEQKIHSGHQIQDYVVSRTKNPLWTPDTGLCGVQNKNPLWTPDTRLCGVQ